MEKINELKEKIEGIEQKLDNIAEAAREASQELEVSAGVVHSGGAERLNNSVELKCQSMGTFIEQIYKNVKIPLIYLCSIIHYLSINSKVNYLSY